MEDERMLSPSGVSAQPLTILMDDDDEDDRLLTRDALEESGANVRLICVSDGAQLLDFLWQRGKFALPVSAPRPDLILLDLNMPRLNGHQALQQIKANETFKTIPVVVLSTSNAPDDIARSYSDGANSYLVKPVTYEDLVEKMAALSRYWSQTVSLPSQDKRLVL